MSLRPLEDALRRALAILRGSGLRGAFGGGLAVIVWGRPRVTQDLDLLIEVEDAAAPSLLRLAEAEGFQADGSAEDLLDGFLRLLPPEGAAPVVLDLLRADTPLTQKALDRARSFSLGDLEVPVLTPEDLILLKLVAFRPKDGFDLETVIDANRSALDLGYLRDWADRLGLRDRLEVFLAPPIP